MEEILDYVDENDTVLGQDTRLKIKEKNLNYRVVHIWVLGKDGKIMICRRPNNKTPYAGLWTSSAGGHVQAGETYETAAKRELKEELALEGELKHLFKIRYKHPRGNYVFTDLWLMVNPSLIDVKNFDKTEILEGELCEFERLKERMRSEPSSFQPQLLRLVHRWEEVYGTKTPSNYR
ncbi:NUDIX domain-containing protein [Candidatus Woesearchaeota archaeon]|nr:NUDIX domain-containing protein [Candidatus Woesearchaeota archaeon]